MAQPIHCIVAFDHYIANKINVQLVEVEVNLRPTVSWPVSLGVR
jgi:hypothetical protein